jgi:hypothetical protein
MTAEVRQELLERIAEDDRVREELAATGELFEGYHPRMEAVHERNARWLAEVVDAYGWPGRALVGEDGAAAAWRIAQHAIGEPGLFRRFAADVEAAVERGEADPSHLAMMTDRIRVFEGRPQVYGTQYDWAPDGSAMVPMIGIEDVEHIDERRRRVGLPPFEPRLDPPPGQSPPTDFGRHAAEGEAWARRVGWRA